MIKNTENGFIALFSVIIISFVLLLMTITSNFAGFGGRFNIFDSENKKRSDEVANACIEQARLKLAIQNTYIGESDEIDIDGDECKYQISSGGEIKAWSLGINKAYTYYYAEVDMDEVDLPTIEFKECPDLSPCP